jgi:hypothetical protein
MKKRMAVVNIIFYVPNIVLSDFSELPHKFSQLHRCKYCEVQ